MTEIRAPRILVRLHDNNDIMQGIYSSDQISFIQVVLSSSRRYWIPICNMPRSVQVANINSSQVVFRAMATTAFSSRHLHVSSRLQHPHGAALTYPNPLRFFLHQAYLSLLR